MIVNVLFYVFGAILVLAALGVITARSSCPAGVVVTNCAVGCAAPRCSLASIFSRAWATSLRPNKP